MESLWAMFAPSMPLFFLATLRIGVAFAAVPAPFGAVTPGAIRAGLCVLVSAPICIALMAGAEPIPLDTLVLLRAALGELLVGAVIGMTVRVTLAAADVAGAVAGQSMGLGFAGTVDPSQGELTLPTAHIISALAMLFFFAFDGHHALIAALARSFQSAPIGHATEAIVTGGIVAVGADMMARGVQIAAPVMATMFIVQLGTALVSRAAPRVHLFALSFSMSIAAGILLLWIAAPSVAVALQNRIQALPDALAEIVGAG